MGQLCLTRQSHDENCRLMGLLPHLTKTGAEGQLTPGNAGRGAAGQPQASGLGICEGHRCISGEPPPPYAEWKLGDLPPLRCPY